MLAIEAVFLGVLTVMAVQLVNARFSIINSYSLWVSAVVVYNLAVMMLMRPNPVERSIIAASAITTDGIFLSLCFQVPSVVLLLVIKWRYSEHRNRVTVLALPPRA